MRLAIIQFLSVLLFVFAFSNADASQINLSFYGYNSTPLGFFDEASTDTIFLSTDGTVGPYFQNSQHYFGFLSKNHQSLGFPLPDSYSDPGCAGYDITCWFEPNSLVIGHVSSSDQNAQLSGNKWQGYSPADFTHLKILFQAGTPCESDSRTLNVPIIWIHITVPAEASTWGCIKAIFNC